MIKKYLKLIVLFFYIDICVGELADCNISTNLDAVINYNGRVISQIRLDKHPIFDTENPQESKRLYSLANQLHFQTKDKVILQLVNLKPGDIYEQSIIDDAERTLRATGYLINNRIYPILLCDGTLEIVVSTKDVWSIIPIFTFSDSDGETTYNLNLQNINLFGTGNNFTLGFTKDDEDSIFNYSFRSPFFLDSEYQLIANYSTGEDVDKKYFSMNKPFRGINAKKSNGFSFLSYDVSTDIRLRNKSFYNYLALKKELELFVGWSEGLYRNAVRRWRSGFNLSEEKFDNQISIFSNIEPIQDSHRLSTWVSYSRFTAEFMKIRNFRTIHRTEDLFVGRSWYGKFQLIKDKEKYGDDFIGLSFSHLNTPFINDKNVFFYKAFFDGLWHMNQNSGEDIIYGFSGEYFWMPEEDRRLVVSFKREWGRSLSLDRLLSQGGNYTLRGYPEYYQLGNERLFLSVEKRFYYDWELWRLLRFATVIYFDAGRAWFTENNIGTLNYTGDKLLTDIGVGLRGVSNRADLYSIGHINIAIPLTDIPELNQSQIGISPKSVRVSIGVFTKI